MRRSAPSIIAMFALQQLAAVQSICRLQRQFENQGETIMDKPKILIVDDDPDLRRGLNLRLRANHFETAYAADGFSAIATAQKERPDLIILDIGLPAGDGFVVLDRLQASATLSSIPVIVLTARDPQYNQERMLRAGATAFLQKPADNNQLMDVIRTTLNPVWPGTVVVGAAVN
jgi:DNA-binding response OmpR family regulator